MSVRYAVTGQASLKGVISVKGSPLAAVGVLAVAILSADKVTLTNVPHLRDIDQLLEELRRFGIAIDWTHGHEITIHAAKVSQPDQPLSSKDILEWPNSLLAAVLIRSKLIQIALPLQDQAMAKLQDLLGLLQQFGATVSHQQQVVTISLSHVHGAQVELPGQQADHTVTAIIAALIAEGESLVDNAVINPEIEDVLLCCRSMKASLEREGESRLRIQGQAHLKGAIHSLVPDRYEAAFIAVATLLSGGDVSIEGIKPAIIMPFLAKMQQLNATYTVSPQAIRFWSNKGSDYKPISLTARPFPGLDMDWLLLFMPLLTQVDGESSLEANDIHQFEASLTALKSYGAEGYLDQLGLHLFGKVSLQASDYTCQSFDDGIVALLASLIAKGSSVIDQAEFVDGRFESLADRLVLLGAKISRTELEKEVI